MLTGSLADIVRGAQRSRRVLLVALIVSLVLAGLALPAGAAAEPVCTNTWTGPAEGTWGTATNWSAGHAPTSTEVACLGTGTTVTVAGGTFHAGVVEDKGTLAINEGTLEISNALEASSTKGLTIQGEPAVLTGPATLSVSGSFTWNSGAMSGSGSTVLQSGATANVGPAGTHKQLVERTFVNEGTTTFGEGQLRMSAGAVIKNVATFIANSQSEFPQIAFQPEVGATPQIINTGTFEKTENGLATTVSVPFENHGSVKVTSGSLAFRAGGSSNSAAEWKGTEGGAVEFGHGSFSLNASTLNGAIKASEGATVSAEGLKPVNVQLSVLGGSFSIATGSMTIEALTVEGETAVVTGPGTISVSSTFLLDSGTLAGSGTTVLLPGATGSMGVTGTHKQIAERTLTNEGTMTFAAGQLRMSNGGVIRNVGTFIANSQSEFPQIAFEPEVGATPQIVNSGLFEKTEGGLTTTIGVLFENLGTITATSGKFQFLKPVSAPASLQWGGPGNPSAPGQQHPTCGDPVSCATGNFSETQTDLSVGGRGVGLNLERTYNSQAGAASVKGAFGYGWSSSFSDHLVVEPSVKLATLTQANGSTVPFTEGTGGSFTAPAWTQDTLSGTKEAGYTLTLENQAKYKFAGASGRLGSITDRNGNATTLTYAESGRLESIADPAGRKITLTYNGGGLVESAKDPMGHVAKYAYEGENLVSVTEPGEAEPRWRFKYDGSHQLTEMTDGRGGKTVNEYDGSHRVVSQLDPLKHKLTFEYTPFETKITNHTTGSVTDEHFTSTYLPVSVTRGFGTASATTESFTYDSSNNELTRTDGNNHTTKYGYDGASNRTSMLDPNKNETKWTCDATHDVETTTTPKGETTTIKRDANGNAESVSRPAPGSTTQTTSYKYNAHGQLTSVEDPLKRIWKYEYNTNGDRTVEIDPETDKRTWGYNEDSQETTMVSPNGHVVGAKEVKFTTTTERDAQGRPTLVTAPLKHETKYTYDKNGNLESVTDPELNKTVYTYDADNQPTKVEEPNKTLVETGYDGAGRVTSQTDGNKHTTSYVRNAVEEVTEVVDPLLRKTTKEYDAAGNLTHLTDPAKRTTTYKYDPANRLTEVSYSDGKTHAVEYEYDVDGDRTKMIDRTGTSKYAYDQLDRLTEAKDGHGDVSSYEYDLANEKTKITYPNGKAVARAFDNVARLKSVTDWSEHTTKFAYDADSNLKSTAFPSGTTNEDTYAYDETDHMSEVKMAKGAEVLASLVYVRNKDSGVTKATTIGLPGEEKPAFTYDANGRLTKGAGIAYKYDAADNPTKLGMPTYTYDAASELETGTGFKYTYDELGERTQSKPTVGPATNYAYDEAGNLTTVTRAHEGEVPAIEDSYGSDGNGLRASQTISGSTTYLSWDMAMATLTILNDGVNSYIYGPGNLAVEQVTSGGTVTYLHHDQQGSTRLLTGSTGTAGGTTTYDAYGNKLGSTGTSTTPLGYDGQYTSADTGFVYLRSRSYDPATAQFLSVDQLVGATRARYVYVNDNPVNATDPTGLCGFSSLSDLGDCVDPTSSGNLAYRGATELSNVTDGVVNLPWLLTRPAVVDIGAVAICATPAIDAVACGPALAAAWTDSTSAVAARGIETNWCDPTKLAAEETTATLLLGFGGLGKFAVGAAGQQGASRLALTLIRGAPVTTQGLLDAAHN
jgi:RHS repeat-associated protein